MKRPFAASVWKEGDWYVSQCLEIDVASQGETEDEALSNLKVRLIEVEVGTASPCVSPTMASNAS